MRSPPRRESTTTVTRRRVTGSSNQILFGAALAWGRSSGLEEEDGDLTKVEVDEVLGLVGDVGAEVTADNAVPGWVVLFVELLLDEGSDVLLNVVLLEGLGRDVDSILLHVLSHVSILNNCLAVCHLR